MALNKTILMKLNEKTSSEPELASFLIKLFEFETESPGWYHKAYADILEKSCKETTKDAHN
jgi:hypothetical protein